MEKIIA